MSMKMAAENRGELKTQHDCCPCYRTSAIHLFKQSAERETEPVQQGSCAMIVQQHIKCHFNEN